jgi:hypothetical protein
MGRVSVHRYLRRSLHLGREAPALAAALLLALAPAGCAVGVGGGNNGFGTHKGAFVDTTVQGLEFNAGGLIGSTDENGTFVYDPGTPVTFFLGDIVVGTGLGTPVMTPVSLVDGAHDESNGTATNIARFLLTIDDDADPTNGIQISDAVRAAARDLAAQGLTVNFTYPPSTFSGQNGAALGILSTATTVPQTTVSEIAAQAHLHVTLLQLLAGDYGGDYTGDDAGSWEVSIDPDGNVTGSSQSKVNADAFNLTGTVTTNGTLKFSATLGLDFTGTIAPDGTISGTWQRLPTPGTIGDTADTQFGSFTGIRAK